MIIIDIPGDLVKLNEHDNVNRNNKFAGAALKKKMTQQVADALVDEDFKITVPVYIGFKWYFSSKHDFDNIRFAAKYVLDGMIKAGVLPNDNQNWVLGFTGDEFIKVEKGHESVSVLVRDEDEVQNISIS